MWYVTYKKILAGQIYDEESLFLWEVVLSKLSEAFNLNRNDYSNFFESYLTALAPLFLSSKASPSELDEDTIKKYILNSSTMDEKNKKDF